MECLKCKDWKENIGAINSGFVMQQVHGFGGYSGKPIVFCPWCSEKLTEVKDADNMS